MFAACHACMKLALKGPPHRMQDLNDISRLPCKQGPRNLVFRAVRKAKLPGVLCSGGMHMVWYHDGCLQAYG